jgi:hypothetical protein
MDSRLAFVSKVLSKVMDLPGFCKLREELASLVKVLKVTLVFVNL